jgi:hypothetical protein
LLKNARIELDHEQYKIEDQNEYKEGEKHAHEGPPIYFEGEVHEPKDVVRP